MSAEGRKRIAEAQRKRWALETIWRSLSVRASGDEDGSGCKVQNEWRDQYTTIVRAKPAQMVLTILNRGGRNASRLNHIR